MESYHYCLKSAGSHSPGTTAGSTWDHQTACPQNSPGTPPGTPAYCVVSRTAARPTAPAHSETGSDDTRTTFEKVTAGLSRRRPLTRSSSDSRLVMWSALRLIRRGWLRCLNKKWSCRAPICRGEDAGQAVIVGRK